MTEQIQEISISEEFLEQVKLSDDFMHKGTVSVEYFDKDMVINDVHYPKGQIACDILNIPIEIIESLRDLATDIIPLVQQMYFSTSENTIAIEYIELCRKQALKIADILSEYKPFSYFGKDGFVKDYMSLLKPASEINNNWSTVIGTSSQAFMTITAIADIAGALVEFRNMVLPIVEEIDPDNYERTVRGYADIFIKHFDKAKMSNGKWIPFAIINQEYIVKNGTFGKRVEFMHLTDIFASDFVEGLTVGHAPKECRMCGRFFLTTNAHHPYYCNEISPDDLKGRTCRKLGKQQGFSENTADVPRLEIKKRALSNLRKAKERGKIAEPEVTIIRKLILEKCEKAAERNDYCNGAYPSEMQLNNLRKEAYKMNAG